MSEHTTWCQEPRSNDTCLTVYEFFAKAKQAGLGGTDLAMRAWAGEVLKNRVENLVRGITMCT